MTRKSRNVSNWLMWSKWPGRFFSPPSPPPPPIRVPRSCTYVQLRVRPDTQVGSAPVQPHASLLCSLSLHLYTRPPAYALPCAVRFSFTTPNYFLFAEELIGEPLVLLCILLCLLLVRWAIVFVPLFNWFRAVDLGILVASSFQMASHWLSWHGFNFL